MLNGIGSQLSHRKQLYAGPLSKLRLLMVSRMAKPEEVLIVEDENGNIVRETMKDNDVLVQYKVRHLCLLSALPLWASFICQIHSCAS
jgi:exportin-1